MFLHQNFGVNIWIEEVNKSSKFPSVAQIIG